MRYVSFALLVYLFIGTLSQIIYAYPSCDGSQLNTTLINSSMLTKTCYWPGGNLYVIARHGAGSGFTYSVRTFNSTNSTLFVSGGGVYNMSNPCVVILPLKYFPPSDYVMQMQTQGTTANQSCYRASLNITSSLLPKTSTTSKPTTVYVSTFTTTIYSTVTTILNITVSPSTPTLVISANTTVQGNNVTMTARAISSKDAVNLLLDGQIVGQGLGITSYTTAHLPPGNNTVQAYDVTLHLYSLPLNVYVLPTSTTSSITSSLASSVSTGPTTMQTTSTTTIQPTNTQPGFFQSLWNAITSFFSHLFG